MSSGVSGVGYTRDSDYDRQDPWAVMMEPAQARSNGMSGVQLKEEDPQVEEFIRWIMDLVAFVLPGSQAKEVEPLLAMLELSMVIDKAAELVRNDSLDNIMNRAKVYQSVLNPCGKDWGTPSTSETGSRRSLF
jgi:baculoviral IAP repeat-containing protein 6